MPEQKRILVLVGQLALLGLTAIIAFFLAEIWLYIAVVLIEAFNERPVLAGAVLVVICAAVFLCFRGATMAPRGVRLPSRAVLLLLSAIAAVAFMEAFTVAIANLAADSSREAYLWFLIPLLLAAFAAAGIKAAFGWRVAYWIVVVAVVAALVVATLAITARNLV
jgi:hypothetical protein